MLAELIALHGREAVAKSLKYVESQNADSMIQERIHLHKLESFVETLGLKPSPAGDHW